ncbi:MAG: N-acetylneuraminate synthase family protein [Spirochaetota bacterium]
MTASPEGARFEPRDDHVLVVAEAGTDHRGDLTRGRELVHAAAEAGADCIKFQHVYAAEILHPRSGTIDVGGRSVPIYDRLRSLERDIDFLERLFAEARTARILPFATPFGIRSARELATLDPGAYKIASPELNHTPLLKQVASFGRPMVLSAGVATLGDVEAALSVIRESAATSPSAIHLLHCVTAYPAPEEEYNLRVLRSLRRIFGVAVGVSDHSPDPEAVPAIATALGASMIEKHLTLERDGHGLDDTVSLVPKEFTRMCAVVRGITEGRTHRSNESEDGPDNELPPVVRELAARFGRNRVEAICGDGIKRLAESERNAYGRSNRSIHAVDDLAAGALLTRENCAILRTERELRPGISPRHLERILGRRLTQSVGAGEGIRWEDLLSH